jgi:tetratricopeptide (TPR) repeat protein
VALTLLVLAGLTGCHDAADREYFAALRGDEDGSSFDERIAHLDRAIELEQRRVSYWEARAVLWIDAREFARAESDLDRAIELADRPYLRFLRGMVLCQSARHALSLSDFDAAISGQPDNAQFYRGRALARVAVGLADQALEDAERLIALAPRNGMSYYAHGMALAALGRDEAALADFDEALRLRPDLVYPLLARAASHERLGHAAAAAADRAEARDKSRERSGCAMCVDPFRY